MYKIGDKLVHPSYGAGVLTAIEKIENSLEIGAPKKDYYVLEMCLNREKVMVPVDNADVIGIRPIISKERAKEVIDVMSQEPDLTVDNWNKRHHDNLVKMKSGDCIALAEVIRDLFNRNIIKGLSSRERKMLINAKRIMVSELCVVLEKDYKEIEESLRNSFSEEI